MFLISFHRIKGRYSLGQFGSAQLLGRLGLNEI